MGSDELNKMRFNKQDKMLVSIMIGFGLYVACNIWGEVLVNSVREFIKHIFI